MKAKSHAHRTSLYLVWDEEDLKLRKFWRNKICHILGGIIICLVQLGDNDFIV